MLSDRDISKAGLILGAAALALAPRNRTTEVSPGASSYPDPQKNVIAEFYYQDSLAGGSQNLFSDSKRDQFTIPFTTPTRWGQQIVNNSPFTHLGVRGQFRTAVSGFFNIYAYVLDRSAGPSGTWVIAASVENMQTLPSDTFDSGLKPLAAIGLPGFSAIEVGSDRVALGALWFSDAGAFIQTGYAEIYGGYQ